MKPLTNRAARLALLLLVTAIGPATSKAADNLTDALEVVRSTYAADRQVFVAESMDFTEKESAAFWPVYRQYRAAREALGDELVKVVLEYADVYPNVPEERAKRLLKSCEKLEKKLLSQKQSYLKKFSKILPPAKVLRFAQLENRMDLVLRLQLASVIPLSPNAKGTASRP